MRLLLAVTVGVMTASATQAEIHFQPSWHFDIFQPVFGKSPRAPGMLLGGVNVTFLQFGRLHCLGGGIGLSSSRSDGPAGAGGVTLVATVAKWRVGQIPFTHLPDNTTLGINYVYDLHLKSGGIAIGLALGY